MDGSLDAADLWLPRVSVRRRITRATDMLLGITIVTFLAAMVLLVFVNVVLRYGFNTGLSVSDELARFLFVWMTFLGAILGHRRRLHAGVTMLRDRLHSRMQVAFDASCEIIILFCSILLVRGAWKLALSNHDNLAPLTKIPMSLFYGVGVVTGCAFLLISGFRLVRLSLGLEEPAERSAGADLVHAE